jgi:hypothetical protein
MDRRKFIYGICSLGISYLTLRAKDGLAQSTPRPIWLSFGLNGPAASQTNFPLTAAFLSKPIGSSDTQLQISNHIAGLLRADGGVAELRDAIDIGDGLYIGAVLDYENVLRARLGSTSFFVLHLVGHGVILRFDRNRGWQMISSFPFPVTMLRETEGKTVNAEIGQFLLEAYTAPTGSFASNFVKFASRLKGKWKEAGSGFNIRITNSAFHQEASAKLNDWKLGKHITETWFGHLASAAACDGLGVPVVPFSETRALGQFTYKFSDRLTAQNVRLPSDEDIDLRLRVTLRNLARDVKYRAQFGRWEVNRMVVIELAALNDRNEEILSLRFGYQDETPDTLAREEDLLPERDVHFFDMAIYRGLNSLFSALGQQDYETLKKMFVKVDAEQQRKIERFKSIYQRAL